jgi:hypothetical protein
MQFNISFEETGSHFGIKIPAGREIAIGIAEPYDQRILKHLRMALQAVGNHNGFSIGGVDHVEIVSDFCVPSFPAQQVLFVFSQPQPV